MCPHNLKRLRSTCHWLGLFLDIFECKDKSEFVKFVEFRSVNYGREGLPLVLLLQPVQLPSTHIQVLFQKVPHTFTLR